MSCFLMLFLLGVLAATVSSQPTQPKNLFTPQSSALRSSANSTKNATISERATGNKTNSTAACFPASALANVWGAAVRMDKLRIGDVVSTGADDRESPVYLFGHKVAGGSFRFASLHTAAGDLVASHGHYVYTADGMVPAGDVRAGDALKRADGTFASVKKVGEVWAAGLYNPHTLDGDIVVDGFAVSTYTVHVPPRAAKTLLSPVRALFRAVGIAPSPACLAGPTFGRDAVLAAQRWLSRFV